MAVRYEVLPFEPAHATLHMRITERAYAPIPAHARPTHDETFHHRMHDASNPAGPSIVAIASEGGREVAMLSAVPFRFRTRAGLMLNAYQPTALVVDPAVGARGIGHGVFRTIVEAVAARDRSLVYAYPNQRSAGLCRKIGFIPVQTVPTQLFPRFRFSARGDGTHRGPGGRRWAFRRVRDPLELRAAIPEDSPAETTGFIRDRANFEWRFGGPAAARYTLVLCEAENPRDSFAIACIEHHMKGLPFTVLVDGYPASFVRHFATAVQAAAAAAGRVGPRVVFASTNLPSLEIGAREPFPRPIVVPTRFHPRPIDLVSYPTPANPDAGELRAAVAMTGDWLGF